ncbi:single-stranded DNA-binding protein [Pseudomonas gingeri]|uniref:single-stranded DNA-binding protein n=1 Tax=Pseudomonas gingeri TaxID=117681 RepID=UPI0015A11AA9|nr:single-stranded DNA-binding protein [Pseudomonas gingeri]NWD68218.1 single-stranded DNA-binding protein [Pseudomonas gingeri]
MMVKKDFHFTPVGIADDFCSIQEPDYGNPEKGLGNPRGVYKVDLTVPSKDAQPLINKITKLHEENYAAICEQFEVDRPALLAKQAPGKKLLEPSEGNMPYFINDDGTVTFKFSCYGSYVDKRTEALKPWPLTVVDSQGKRIEEVPAIAGGSELKARFSMFAYGFSAVAGVSVKLQLDSVMLLKLVEFGGGDDDFSGGWVSEAVEGGFETARAAWDTMVDKLPRFR